MGKAGGFTVGSLVGIAQGRPEPRHHVSPGSATPAAVIAPGAAAVGTSARPCCRSMCPGCPWAEAQRRT